MDIAEKIWRIHQVRLAQIDNDIAALRAAEGDALNSLSTLEPQLLLERIAGLAQRRLLMEAARAEVAAKTRELGQRMKMTEKLYAKASETIQSEEKAEQNRQGQRPVSSIA